MDIGTIKDWLRGSTSIDPYLLWAELTHYASFPLSPDRTLPLLLQLTVPYDKAERALQALGLSVPPAYGEGLGRHERGAGPCSKFVTGRICQSKLLAILNCSFVQRCVLGIPRIANADAYEFLFRSMSEPCTEPLTVLGVIDDGFALAHPGLRDAGLVQISRFKRLWDQNSDREHRAPWSAVPSMNYGAELVPPSIAPGVSGEASFYRQVRYLNDLSDPRMARAHGTGVTGVAAGSGSEASLPTCAALSVPIIAVQLPAQTIADTSGGSLAVHVLDGLRYIMWRAEEVEGSGDGRPTRDPSARVVVNLSFGCAAGAHDGQSILEAAMDELVEVRKNLAIVLPAGNSRDARIHAAVHAPAAKDGEPGVSNSLEFVVLPDDPTDSYFELWFSAGQAIDELRVHLRAPDGTGQVLKVGELASFGGGPGWAHALFCRHAAQSIGKSMLLLAIAPTTASRAQPDRMRAPAGRWSARLENDSGSAVQCHAWIERDDLIGRRPVPQQTRFVQGTSACQHFSMSSIAHGRATVVVAGHVRFDAWPADYSSSGPSAGWRWGPDVSATSDEGYAARGVKVFGTRSWFGSERMSGTSVAAPLIARWLLNNCTWASAQPAVRAEAMRQEAAMPGKPGTVVPPHERIGYGRFRN